MGTLPHGPEGMGGGVVLVEASGFGAGGGLADASLPAEGVGVGATAAS
jgi:hypothetical protein